MRSRVTASAPRLTLLRGFLRNGALSLESDKLIVTVDYTAYGALLVTTQPAPLFPPPPPWYTKCERFLPHLACLLFRFFREAPIEAQMSAIGICVFLAYQAWQESHPTSSSFSLYDPLSLAMIPLLSIGFLLADRLSTAHLYGAQRKVISAYLTEGRFDRATVLRQPRTVSLSIERFFVPAIATLFLSGSLHALLGVNPMLVHLILIEILFQIDGRIGLEKIRLTQYLSLLIQEHLTTCEPTPFSLTMAEAALEALLNTHQRLWDSTPISKRTPHLRLIR